MKKILTICFLLAMAFTSQAQNGKPSKEETVKFINTVLQNSIGSYYDEEDKSIIKDVSFGIDSYMIGKKSTILIESNFKQIPWENLVIDYESFKSKIDSLTVGYLKFRTKISRLRNVYREDGTFYKKEEDFVDMLQFYVPTDKVESIKKAFLRLSEIAKEENKDPFQD